MLGHTSEQDPPIRRYGRHQMRNKALSYRYILMSARARGEIIKDKKWMLT